jgi:hypothetical protein
MAPEPNGWATSVPALLAVAAARFEQSEADHEYP